MVQPRKESAQCTHKHTQAWTLSLSNDSEYGIVSPIDEYYRESIFETGTNNRHVYE